jgi:phage terminase large subunit GpA-like protein
MILAEHSEAMKLGWQIPTGDPIWKCADGRYGMDRTRAGGAMWELQRTPWVKQILDDFKRDDVREIVMMAGSQCAKTAPSLIALAWSCAFDPCPTLWITGNDELAKDASQERIQPTLERCPDVAPLLLNNRLDKTTWKVRLKTMTLDIAGAQSSTALEQNPYARVFCDEVRQWPSGHLQKVEKRQRSYERAKRMLFSTPNVRGDEFHQRFMSGTQYEWMFPCQGCKKDLTLDWKAMKYGENPVAGDGGGRGVAWVHLECECKATYSDAPQVRRYIIESGHWQAQNLAPQAGVASYHWNALLPPWIRWADLVVEWQKANDLRKLGNIEPLKIFICETLGEPWEDKIEVADFAALGQRKTAFVAGESWPFTKRIFLTCDVQQDVIYWTARAWGLGGVSQQIDYGREFTFDGIRTQQLRLAIKDNDVAIDSGFRTSEVYQQCQRFGWHPMKGTPQGHFVHHLDDKSTVQRIWSVTRADPAMGTGQQGQTTLPLFLFSSDAASDMLALFMAGSGPEWGLISDVSEEYLQQLAAEKAEIDAKSGKRIWKRVGRNNHWRDCEKMNLVAAIIIGLVASDGKTK